MSTRHFCLSRLLLLSVMLSRSAHGVLGPMAIAVRGNGIVNECHGFSEGSWVLGPMVSNCNCFWMLCPGDFAVADLGHYSGGAWLGLGKHESFTRWFGLVRNCVRKQLHTRASASLRAQATKICKHVRVTACGLRLRRLQLLQSL